MITLPEMPPSIAKLPRDERGYPCPWFISWVDGKPEFRAMDGSKLRLAIRNKLCWVCGEPLQAGQFQRPSAGQTVQQVMGPGAVLAAKVGKHESGRLLDEMEWSEFPDA